MKPSKFVQNFSDNRSYFISRAVLIIVVLSLIAGFTYYSEKVDLTRAVERLPQSYLALLDRSIRHTDMVAECKASYATDMDSAALKQDKEVPSFIVQSILRCQDLEASIAKQKANTEKFYSSDFFTRLKAGEEFSFDQMYEQKKAFRVTAEDMEAALIRYSKEEDKYYHEKLVQAYNTLKRSVGDMASEPQISSRFETIDRAISTGDRRLFVSNYKELQNFLNAYQVELINKELAKQQQEINKVIKQKRDDGTKVDKEQSWVNDMIKNRVDNVTNESLKTELKAE